MTRSISFNGLITGPAFVVLFIFIYTPGMGMNLWGESLLYVNPVNG